MARQPRFILPGYPQHVIQRGNNRHVIFADEADYQCYLDTLAEACDRFDCRVHAYVLMTNHVHMLMTPDRAAGIGKVMQSLGRRYVQYFNRRYRRTGTLWEGRYKAALLDTESYLMACYRYIELNPVRAGLAARPDDYPWSSYRCNALGETDALVKSHELYLLLAETAVRRYSAYRALFTTALEGSAVAAIREATNKAWVLGDDRFRLEIGDLLQRQAAPKPRGGDRKSAAFRKYR